MKQTGKPPIPSPWLNETLSLNWQAIWEKNWFEVCLTMLCLYLVASGSLRISVEAAVMEEPTPNTAAARVKTDGHTELSLAPAPLTHPQTTTAWKASDFHNLDFVLNPDLAWQKGVPLAIVEQKFQICLDYIQQHQALALENARKYGVPASITLAQALLESDAGMSRLALESNNHFGIKCKRKCLGCTCRNYADDDRYDMFRVFSSTAESFIAHARLLNSSRYQHLKKFGKDYRQWAEGLKKAGYATDPRYAQKLVRIIETLRLHLLDEGGQGSFAR